MPLYTYRCWHCGASADVQRAIQARDNIVRCACGAWKRRAVAATGGLVGKAGLTSPGTQLSERIPAQLRIPNITMTNCTVVNCGTAVSMDGGHLVARGLTVLQTPVAFDLNNGATVDAVGVLHRAPGAEAAPNGGQRKRRRRRGRRS